MDIINKEDMSYEREKSVKALDTIIDDLSKCLTASKTIKKQFDAGDSSFNFNELRDALNELSDYVESRNYRLSIGERDGVAQIENYIANVENPYEEESKIPKGGAQQ
jgi:hypothetical protein